MRRIIGLDTETFYSKDYSITNLGNYHYTRDPRFDCYLVSVSDGTESWVGPPSELNWDALKDAHLFSHNAGFDQAVVQSMQERGIVPPFDYYAWDCTADLCAYMINKRALGQAVQHFYDHRMSKAVRSDMKGKRVEDLSPEEKDALYKYGDDDAIWCQRLAADHFAKWPEMEVRLSRLTREQGAYGVQVDEEALRDGIRKVSKARLDILSQLPWVDRGYKPTSPKGIAEECTTVGIPTPPVKTHDEAGFYKWEAEYAPKYPWIGAIGEMRSINKYLKSLETIRDRVREDGTMPFSLLYFGAHTGRFSGAGGFNMQNMMVDQFYGVDMRGLFIPRPGKKFITVDLSQIEARVVQWLAGNETLLEKVAQGYSIYEAYARITGRWEGEETLKTADPKLYKRVKAAVLGLGFGCGPDKYVSLARQYGVDFDIEESKAEVEDFRQRNPAVTKLWRQLDNGLRQSVGSDYYVELPNGRTMNYREVRYESKLFREPDGKVRRKTICTADIGRRAGLYGGLLTENITQATARDIFAEGLLRLDDAGHKVLWTVHDEAICEVGMDVTAKEIEDIMAVSPDWMPGLPVGAEAQEVMKYGK